MHSRRFQLEKKRGVSKDSNERKRHLQILHRAASLFKKAAQGRVTDKAKEAVGSKPAVAYGRQPLPLASACDQASDTHGLASFFIRPGGEASSSGAAVSGANTATESILYLPHTVVFIVGVGRRLEIAELTEPLTQFTFTTGEVRVSRQRIACRYFIETRELLLWPPAKAYWAVHGISDTAAAEHRAGESDGAHFSFYSTDTVAHSAMLGAALSPFEKDWHGTQLVSLALTSEELEAAREQLSGGIDLPVDDEQSQRMEAAAQAEAGARARAEAAAQAQAAADAAFEHMQRASAKGRRRKLSRRLRRRHDEPLDGRCVS